MSQLWKNSMRQFSFAIVMVLSVGTAAPALAASMVNVDQSVTIDANDPFSFTTKFNGFTDGFAPVPGLSGLTKISYVMSTSSNKKYLFSFSVTNTSSAPLTSSRISIFGFDVDPNVKVSTSSATGTYSTVGAGNVPIIGDHEICFKAGGASSNCAGGGSGGAAIGQTVNGTFTLSFDNSVPNRIFKLSNFFVRYQDVRNERRNGPSSAVGQTVSITESVPEPASWLAMIAGFGVMGIALRRRGNSVARLAA